MANLRINYQSVMNRAQEMENQITRLSREINSMESLRNQSRACWDGPASEVFRRKLDQLIDNTRATQRRMKNVVEDIRTVADRIRREDEELAKRAAQLKE